MSNGQSQATVDNLLAQMRQTQNSLNGWDVVFNLLDNPVNAIFQMEFAGTPNRAWKQVTIAYCQAFPDPNGGGQLAVYTALDVTLSQPLLQFGSGHKSVADIRFVASGEFKTAVQRVGAGFDPVPFIAEQHARIPVLHIRDGQRGQRGKAPWGTGDVPIKDVLQLLKREKYAMVADIEYDYGGAMDPMNEIGKCFEFCKNALD